MKGYSRRAFTLIEMLVVISIIAVLMGLAFPAFQGVQNAARKTQAKNDMMQIVTAANAFYTEYGRYPIPAGSANTETDFTYDTNNANSTLMNILMAKNVSENPRAIVFLQPQPAKSDGAYGLQTDAKLLDPWATQYFVRIDIDYDNSVRNPVNDADLMTNGVIAWSSGKDRTHAYNSPENEVNRDNIYSYK